MGRYVADVTGLYPRCFATGTTWHPSAHPPTATAPQISASSVVAPPDVAAAADAGIGVTARHAADGLALVTATAAAAEPAAAPLPLLPRLESEAFQFRGTGVFSRKAVAPVTVAAGVSALPDAWAAEQRQALTIQWRELPPLAAVRLIGAPPAAATSGAPPHVASATKEQMDELVIARRAARRASRQLSRNYKAAHATAHGVAAAAATASRGGSPSRADASGEAGSGSERHSAHAPASSSTNQAPREGGSGADDDDCGDDKRQHAAAASLGPLASPPLLSSTADAFLGSPLSLAKAGGGGGVRPDPRAPTANDRNDATWYLVGTVEWAEALAQVGGA